MLEDVIFRGSQHVNEMHSGKSVVYDLADEVWACFPCSVSHLSGQLQTSLGKVPQVGTSVVFITVSTTGVLHIGYACVADHDDPGSDRSGMGRTRGRCVALQCSGTYRWPDYQISSNTAAGVAAVVWGCTGGRGLLSCTLEIDRNRHMHMQPLFLLLPSCREGASKGKGKGCVSLQFESFIAICKYTFSV